MEEQRKHICFLQCLFLSMNNNNIPQVSLSLPRIPFNHQEMVDSYFLFSVFIVMFTASKSEWLRACPTPGVSYLNRRKNVGFFDSPPRISHRRMNVDLFLFLLPSHLHWHPKESAQVSGLRCLDVTHIGTSFLPETLHIYELILENSESAPWTDT